MPNLSTSTARPDLVIVSENNVTMIEITIPSESRAAMIKAKERKNKKPNYNSLIGDLEDRGLSVNYRKLEIGSLGHYLPDAVFCISRSFQLTKSETKQVLHKASKGGGGEMPFHVIGRKYTEGTNSRSHAYSTPNVRVHRG